MNRARGSRLGRDRRLLVLRYCERRLARLHLRIEAKLAVVG